MPINFIQTKTFGLESFTTHHDVNYAILSHTWASDELKYFEWVGLYPSNGHNRRYSRDYTPEEIAMIKEKAGFLKIEGAVSQALRDGYEYVWVDTVCINKESSAELTEAINSMFNWYHDAAICYAYLADVHVPKSDSPQTRPDMETSWFAKNIKNRDSDTGAQFEQSRWWTRGWTLQEFLASKVVQFFSAGWTPLGTKHELADWIPQFTTIHKTVIEDRDTIPKYTVAQRMSWVSNRQTTVIEDMSYCLMGLFNINMPMLYGEGKNAFLRLQKEIIKISDDQSIFAWNLPEPSKSAWTGILAPSPANFRHCGSIVRDYEIERTPYSVTNKGLMIQGPAIIGTDLYTSYFSLACSFELRGQLKKFPNGTVSQSTNRCPIWIVLRPHLEQIYERRHYPQSTLHFEPLYPLFNIPSNKELMVSLSVRPTSTLGRCSEVHWDAPPNRSGIIVRNGFGIMKPVSGIYSKVWNPLVFSTTSLCPQGPSMSSHELVRGGSFTVLISVSWDECGQAERQMVTNFHDPSRQIVSSLSNNFTISENPTGIEEFHDSMKIKFRSSIADDREDIPLVIIRRERMQDLNGRAWVVADIVFKEKSYNGSHSLHLSS